MKTRQHLFSLLLLAGLLFAGCNNDDISVQIPAPGTGHTLKITASMPVSGDADTRVSASQKTDSKDIELRWKERDVIQFYFKQGNNLIKGDPILLDQFSADGKQTQFNVPIPGSVDTRYPFDLYGVHGAQSAILDNAIVLDGRPSRFQPLDEISLPLFFKAPGLTEVTSIDVTFRHYGALHVLTLKNTSASVLEPKNIFLNISGNPWFHLAAEQTIPVYDLISETTLQKSISFDMLPLQPVARIAGGDNVKLAQWVMPNGQNPPGFALAMTLDQGQTISSDTKPARTGPLEQGHAYHLYALCGGTALTFSDEEAATKPNFITFTTTKPVNSKVGLHIDADVAYRNGVWLDLNNDGKKDSGESVTQFGSTVYYTIGAQTVTLYGNVKDFRCNSNQIYVLDVSNNLSLITLQCSGNQLTALDVSNNGALKDLECSNNWLTALDVRQNSALKELRCYDNLLTALNVTQNNALGVLYCSNNSLDTLNLRGNTALTHLYCERTQLTELDVTQNTALQILFCYNNRLTTLNVGNNTSLTSLGCDFNQIDSLDVSSNKNLLVLECAGNQLTALDITNNPNLVRLKCYKNKIKEMEMQKVVDALPMRLPSFTGTFIPVQIGGSPADENICTKAQVTKAKDKNWIVTSAGNWQDYEGS